MNQLLLLRDNAKPLINLHTREETVLPPASPKSLQLPSFWSSLKDAFRKRRFSDENEPKHSVYEELRRFSKEYYATGIQRLTQGGGECVDSDEDLWKNNLNVVKDVPMIYVNFIITVIILSGE